LKTVGLLLLILSMAVPVHGQIIWRGTDISFLPQVEAGGGIYTVDGEAGDLFDIFADHGVNLIRLRLWHTPTAGWCDLEQTLTMARRAHDAGQQVLLDFHYSDTWADPGHQVKPTAWTALTFATLADSVRARTRDVLLEMIAQGTPPAIVQLGNEITGGFLWDDGRIGGAFDTPEQWTKIGQLLGAAVDGVDDAFVSTLRPRIMIHSDRGADNASCRWFFNNLVAQGVDFDIIGLSYYPWWHGSLTDLETNLDDLAVTYGKDLVVVETAYPWTLGWFDDTHNSVGQPDQLLPGFPDTAMGQRAFLDAIFTIVNDVPEDRGRGIVYWAPEWITSPGFGSGWENMALFDESGEVLPGLGAFATSTAAAVPQPSGLRLRRIRTDGSGGVMFAVSATVPRQGVLRVYDARGHLIADVWRGLLVPEDQEISWRPVQPFSGTLLYRLTSGTESITKKILNVR
jgi:arabinogalactan endo-1,4-beta-galactosidase